MGKSLTWQKFCLVLSFNILVITGLVLLANLLFTPLEEFQCRQQIRIIQTAINAYNRAHPAEKKLQFEFGFPGFIEQTLIPQGYIINFKSEIRNPKSEIKKEAISDIRETHSYYLERNGFVNCRIHQRNPISIMILGISILSILATVLAFAFLGYQIKYKEN
ncbi:MAG: hypothetical protein QME64_09040 [bacterium]|nr:hypothetical protein [bacterium]